MNQETGRRRADREAKDEISGHTTLAAARAAIQKLRADLNRTERERDVWKAKSESQAAEMDRRSRNENRNCLSWGPCSRHDGWMETAD